MTLYLLIFSLIVITCVYLNRFSGKIGIPVLLFFLLLGLICGSQYDDFAIRRGWIVGDNSTIALIFIMFYGGFGTRWKSARPVAIEAGLLSTLGVALTALTVGVFCHYALAWNWLESLLMGSVISSTDAATVFSILRTRKMGLKNNTAPLLEIESGSNDPMSFMLTAVMMSLFNGSISAGNIVWEIISQVVFGAAGGILIASVAVMMLRWTNIRNNGFDILIFISIALASYALPDMVGGNGYLSAYIVGIILGNSHLPGRKPMVTFFDAITSLMQIAIFFLLGMLAIPSALVKAFIPAFIIFTALTFMARPLAVYGILLPFRKYPFKQMGLISFVGLRGAASIVFAITILTSGIALENDIFSIVFCIVIISIAVQGSLIPAIAKLTSMTDEDSDVMTTFSDFKESSEMTFGTIHVAPDSTWNNTPVSNIHLPGDCLIVLVIRGKERIIPQGDTVLQAEDKIVICAHSYHEKSEDNLVQHPILEKSRWVGRRVSEFPKGNGNLIIMIQRGEEKIIPHGNTLIQKGDIIVIMKK